MIDNNTIFEAIKTALTDHPHIQLAIVYGSVVNNRMSVDSDIDIGVSAGRILSIDERISLISDLSHSIKREIDLVDLGTIHGLLLYEILTKGKQIICKSSCLKADFMKEVVYFVEDFLPQIREFLDRRIRRFAFG